MECAHDIANSLVMYASLHSIRHVALETNYVEQNHATSQGRL